MVRRQFNIIHYVYFTAIASVLFAFLLSPSLHNLALAGAAVLMLSACLTVFVSPVFWILRPFLPRSPESRLLHLPEDPEERIALLEGIVARPLWLGSGARRSVRVKLVQLYRERGRCAMRSTWGGRHLPDSACRIHWKACCASR